MGRLAWVFTGLWLLAQVHVAFLMGEHELGMHLILAGNFVLDIIISWECVKNMNPFIHEDLHTAI
jgi:hypothetical protein